jgi:hypothetical protein
VFSRSYATANHILFSDGRQALGQLFEVGADITETDQIIKNQTNLITLTEVNGFWVIDAAASYYLDVAT